MKKTVLITATPDTVVRVGHKIHSITVGDVEYLFSLEGKRETIQAIVPDKYITIGELTGAFSEEVHSRASGLGLDIVKVD